MHNYHDTYKAFPYPGSEDPKLGLGLSWRVRLLPFVKEGALYSKFDHNSPWDSPQNKALIAQMPDLFKAPGVTLEEERTVYLGVLGGSRRASRTLGEPDRITFFEATEHPTTLPGIKDGTSNTVMILEADPSEAAIWTRPDDWEYDPQSPRRGLGSLRGSGFAALFVNGTTVLVPNTVSDEDLRRLFLTDDGQLFDAYIPP
jgi:hypothetical protein